ncbi:MAG: hypothetical protein QOF49_469 [Chloroflexota bacterium]|nr:hypothetical protein [Chloroflexota bacterium]
MPELPAGGGDVSAKVDVQCTGNARAGWTCFAVIREGDGRVSEFEVRVTEDHLERLAPGAVDPTDLVERSFAFLLGREPPGSILRAFDLLEIARYFPEYEGTIRPTHRP